MDSPHTLIYYESPHRLLDFLKDALEVFGDRDVAIANDLTKKFEVVYRGSISEMITHIEAEEILGEYVVVIKGVDN
jgi:16S rRNA (cytidine1402-2'-O)-methyltransferase